MKIRGMAVFLAILLAFGATLAVFLYVRGVKDEAKSSSGSVNVIVSKLDVQSGTPLDPLVLQGGFTTRSFPRGSLVEGVVTDLSQLRGQIAGSIILAGEQISLKRLAALGTSTAKLGLHAGFVAVTVPIDRPKLVGGNISKDDHVTVYATVGDATLTLIPNAHVLEVTGVATTTSGGTVAAGGAVTVTFELRPVDSQKLVLAQEKGSLWMALLPPGAPGTRQAPLTVNGLNR
jgi:Flp pilus assembly protein CpaB